MVAEWLFAAESVEEIEVLPEGGPPAGVIEPQAVDPGLGPAPGFDDDPGPGLSPPLEGEEPLEAVDEEESSPILDDDEGVIAVEIGAERPGLEELKGDLLDGDLAHGHDGSPL